MSIRFRGRLGLQQRVLPNYRAPFFDMLAEACDGGLSLFSGMARASEGITPGELQVARQVTAGNIHILGGSAYLCYQRGMLDWLEEWNPEALIVEANPRYLATPAAVKWMHARGRRVLGWGLGAPPVNGMLAGLRRAKRIDFLQQFDGLIAYSQRGAGEYADAGYPRERITIAPNAAAGRPSKRPKTKPARVKRPTLLFVGRLQGRKRVDALLRACAAMPEPKPRLIIVGDGPERSTLERLASEVYPMASFAGAKHGAELEPHYAEADLFVLPGTGGLAIQEAMAHGLPVIVAKGDGTQDDLVRVGNGWQIAAGEDAALRDTLREALSDVGRLRRMGAESYRIVREEINLEKMVEAFVKALEGTRAG
jgi:glycosyltransferase involved in cell wall biosynthesis